MGSITTSSHPNGEPAADAASQGAPIASSHGPGDAGTGGSSSATTHALATDVKSSDPSPAPGSAQNSGLEIEPDTKGEAVSMNQGGSSTKNKQDGQEGETPKTEDTAGEASHKLDLIQDDDSGDESVSDLEDDINNDLRYPTLSYPLEKRIKAAPKRLLQSLIYSKLVEDRIKELEKRLASMEARGSDPPVAPPDPDIPLKRRPVLKINHITFDEYRSVSESKNVTKTSEDKDDRYHHEPTREEKALYKQQKKQEAQLPFLIDVIGNAAAAPDQSICAGSSEPAPLRTHPVRAPTDLASDKAETKKIQHPTPERIQINSILLLETLEKISGLGENTYFGPDKSGLRHHVFLRPFKLLVPYEQEIRKYAENLATKHKTEDGEKDPAVVESSTAGLQSEGSETAQGPGTAVEGECDSQQKPADADANSPAETEPANSDEDQIDSKRCLEELKVLIQLFDTDLKPLLEIRQGVKDATLRNIAFQDLWYLFSVGDDIRAREGPVLVYRVEDVNGGRPFLSSKTAAKNAGFSMNEADRFDGVTLTVSCFSYETDGKQLGTIQNIFDIKQYEGEKTITSLDCFPIAFSEKDGPYDRNRVIQRGKRFLELHGSNEKVVHKQYNGLTVDMEGVKEECDSEVIIDPTMAIFRNPSLQPTFGIQGHLIEDPRETQETSGETACRKLKCCSNNKIYNDYGVDRERSARTVKEHETLFQDPALDGSEILPENYLLFPYWIHGYNLRSRKWVRFDVEIIEDITPHQGGFDSLVLPPGHKETLLALVQNHSKGISHKVGQRIQQRQIDLVRGKGKGLIILLHGEPGVGKTSTAECVAEHTSRPLFQVTCGDIGESADTVERNLENHFQLAHKWGCVLLLDEADVFLMRRSRTDLKRNAIVSVFLRVLEYYSGILFLTTNRVGIFDQAFRSRIHMSLFYPKLDQDATRAIWTMNLDRTRRMWHDSIKITDPNYALIVKYSEDHFKDLEKLKTKWNGRQIRNAFQTAIALAEYDAHQDQIKYELPTCPKPSLEVSHFQKVAKASKHFDAYLRETAGLEEDLARESSERRDDLVDSDIEKQVREEREKGRRTAHSKGGGSVGRLSTD